MDYASRSKVITDFLEKLDVEKFDVNNLSYLDKKFGDCIVPYPDKEHKNTVIENSFESNKIQAQGWIPDSDIKLDTSYAEKLEKLEQEYAKKLADLEKDFNDLKITKEEFDAKKLQLEKEFQQKVKVLDEEIANKIKKREEKAKTEQKTEVKQNKNSQTSETNWMMYIIVSILVIVWSGIAVVSYKFKNKK